MTPTPCKDTAGARTPNGNRDSRRCSYCGGEFKPRRRSARFCSSTCRVAAHRRTGCNANSTTDSLPEAPPASQTGSEAHSPMSEPKNASAGTKTLSVTESSEASIQPRLLQDEDVTLTAPILRGSKPLPWKIVPDTKCPVCIGSGAPMTRLPRWSASPERRTRWRGWCHEAP